MPGEYREYPIGDKPESCLTPGGCSVVIRFHRNRAVHFTVNLPLPAPSSKDALLLAGIDVGKAHPRIVADAADRWSGEFNGVYFVDVMGGKGILANVVQARVN